MNKRELGLRIKSFRKEKGLSQKELASLMGYKDVSTIAKIETGVNDVTTETLYKLAVYNFFLLFILSFSNEIESNLSANSK